MIKTKRIIKKITKKWNNRIASSLRVVEKANKKQIFDSSHTSDGKKLNLGLKVFVLEDPSVEWVISKIENKITLQRGIITLTANKKDPIKKHPTQLFINQKKAINACIKDIEQRRNRILKDMQDSIDRLDPVNRTKKLIKLRKSLNTK